MAHPKRRQSKTRTLKRRTHDKAVAPTWQNVLIAVSGMYIIQFVLLAVIIEENWQLKRLL